MEETFVVWVAFEFFAVVFEGDGGVFDVGFVFGHEEEGIWGKA